MREPREWGQPWSAAVLSPWPGAGASLVTVAAGAVIDAGTGAKGQTVIFMDADLRTAGLTSLLTAWQAPGGEYGPGPAGGDGGGLAGFALDHRIALADRSVQSRLQDLRSPGGTRTGDMTLLAVRGPGSFELAKLTDLADVVGQAAQRLAELAGCLLVDCGPGWSPLARRLCETVEFIFLVGPPDGRTHFELHALVRQLEKAGLKRKLAGYVANRSGPDQRFVGQSRLNEVGGARSRDTLPIRTVLDLPYDPVAAQQLGQGQLPAAGSPFGRALCRGMEALEPDLFRTGFGPGGA